MKFVDFFPNMERWKTAQCSTY